MFLIFPDTAVVVPDVYPAGCTGTYVRVDDGMRALLTTGGNLKEIKHRDGN